MTGDVYRLQRKKGALEELLRDVSDPLEKRYWNERINAIDQQIKHIGVE